MKPIAEAYAKSLTRLTGFGAAVYDTEQIIAVAGTAKKFCGDAVFLLNWTT